MWETEHEKHILSGEWCNLFGHRTFIVVPLQCQKKGIENYSHTRRKKFPRALKSFASRSSKNPALMTRRK